jgi:peptidoglycan/LPS O-acetylase OafA/YrhL
MEGRRSVSLDALRGAAALSVAIPHFLLFREAGGDVAEFIPILAVEVFFVLSGFVLAPQLHHIWTVGGRDVLVFYCRRWVRTLPPYYVILTCIAIVTGYFGGRDFFEYAFFVRNLTSVKEQGEFFLPAWSLAVEEWFYLVFPVYLLVTRRLGATLLGAAIGFVVGCYAIKLVIAVVAPELLMEARRIVVFRVDSICCGVILFALIKDRRQIASPVWGLGIFLTTAFAVVASYVAAAGHREIPFMISAELSGCALIMSALWFEEGLRKHAVLARIAKFLAATSYTVYLAHMLILLLMTRSMMWLPLQFVVYLSATLAFAGVFYSFVEKPLLASRPRYRLRAAEGGSGLLPAEVDAGAGEPATGEALGLLDEAVDDARPAGETG